MKGRKTMAANGSLDMYWIERLTAVVSANLLGYIDLGESLGFSEIAKLPLDVLVDSLQKVVTKNEDIALEMRREVAILGSDAAMNIFGKMIEESEEMTVLEAILMVENDISSIEWTVALLRAAMQVDERTREIFCKTAIEGHQNMGCFLNDGQIENVVLSVDRTCLMQIIHEAEVAGLGSENTSEDPRDKSTESNGTGSGPDSDGLPGGDWTSSGDADSSGGALGNP